MMGIKEFEKIIFELTKPINGQYPRPWIADLTNPIKAKVFIIGKNQAKTFSELQVGSHKIFLDALFNRNNQSCRGLYDKITHGIPSPTRQNIDKLSSILKGKGIKDILETNVICYSTHMSADLYKPIHKGGKQRGDEIFQTLISIIKPSVLIVHGVGAKNTLEKTLKTKLPSCPKSSEQINMTEVDLGDYKPKIIVLPSLAPPAYNKWSNWSNEYFEKIANYIS